MRKNFEIQEYIRSTPPLVGADLFTKKFGSGSILAAYFDAYSLCRGTLEAEAWARGAAKERCQTLEEIKIKGLLLSDYLTDLKEESVIGWRNTGKTIAHSILRDAVLLAHQ